jgi:hypothetical protein
VRTGDGALLLGAFFGRLLPESARRRECGIQQEEWPGAAAHLPCTSLPRAVRNFAHSGHGALRSTYPLSTHASGMIESSAEPCASSGHMVICQVKDSLYFVRHYPHAHCLMDMIDASAGATCWSYMQGLRSQKLARRQTMNR